MEREAMLHSSDALVATNILLREATLKIPVYMCIVRFVDRLLIHFPMKLREKCLWYSGNNYSTC